MESETGCRVSGLGKKLETFAKR